MTYVSNGGSEFIILQQTGKDCVVQFTETGYVRRANIDNIRAGKVKDYYQRSVYGVGYLGEFARLSHWKRAKELWKNMIKRCYYEKDELGYFHKGTTVDPHWHCFANFVVDVVNLSNFDLWNQGSGYQLDKDLRVPGCNVYSPETCSFVTEFENKQAGKKDKKYIDGKWVTTIS